MKPRAATLGLRPRSPPLEGADSCSGPWSAFAVEARVEAFARAAEKWLWLGTWAETDAARIPPFDAVGLGLVRLFESTGASCS